jgi:Flp pilus assembly CpaE family ATPase
VKSPVLTAAQGAAWEAAWVTAFERSETGVHVARRCVDVVDLLGAAVAGHGRAALLSAQLRHLDVDVVDRLVAAQVVPIGVTGRADVAAEDRLRAMGIERLVPEDADAAVVAAVVLDALAAVPEAAPSRGFADPFTTASIAATPGTEPVDELPVRHGRVIAVWGPTGAPGRTTLAVGLADEISRLGPAGLLIDADVYGGVIASVVGLVDESPGLAAACRAAGTARLDNAGLAALCWQLTPALRVLTGIPLAQRWPEIRASAIGPVLSAARALADVTVVDCGFSLEADEEISFDSLAPRRNGATLAVLDAADLVVVVGSADAIGLQRLVRGLSDLRDAEVGTELLVVLNKANRGGTGREPGAEAAAAVQRFAGRNVDGVLPYDRDALDAALAVGRTLAEVRPGSPLRASLTRLARTVTGIESRSSRRRRG